MKSVYVGNRVVLVYDDGPGSDAMRYYLNANDLRATPDVLQGSYEPWAENLFDRLLKADQTVVDVGASFGYFTLMAADRVGKKGKVIAFEPSPVTSHLLRMNIETNGFATQFNSRVMIVSKAVAAEIGEAEFWADFEFTEGSHLQKVGNHPARNEGGVHTVPVTTLDEELAGMHIDVIKIDVEGAEHLVWKGMQKIVTENPNIKLFVEFHRYQMSFEEADGLLHALEDRFNVCGRVEGSYDGLSTKQ